MYVLTSSNTYYWFLIPFAASSVTALSCWLTFSGRSLKLFIHQSLCLYTGCCVRYRSNIICTRPVYNSVRVFGANHLSPHSQWLWYRSVTMAHCRGLNIRADENGWEERYDWKSSTSSGLSPQADWMYSSMFFSVNPNTSICWSTDCTKLSWSVLVASGRLSPSMFLELEVLYSLFAGSHDFCAFFLVASKFIISIQYQQYTFTILINKLICHCLLYLYLL